MSKGNMLLGQARGKVGDLVFSRANGQQITRSRATVVSNPQTEKQMIQRIILNTVAQAYSRMAEICDHSFEGVPVGQRSMSRFLTLNMNALRTKVANYINEEGTMEGVYAFAPKGTNIFTPNHYIISSGQLPEVQVAAISATDGATILIAKAADIPTYAEVIASLGLQRGDQLTFIGQELYTDGRAAFKFARVILDPRNADGTQAELSTPFLANGVVNLPSPRNEGSDVKFTTVAGGIAFDLGENSQYGAGVIVSRQKSDGSWLRSNCTIALTADLPYALVGAYDLQGALEYAMGGGIDLESERYLNNAVRGKKIVAPTPSPSPSPTPTPGGDPTLTQVQVNGSNLLNPDSQEYYSDMPQIDYAGTDLNGSYICLADGNISEGGTLDISSLANDKKFALTGDSGSTTGLLINMDDTKRIYLVKDNTVVSRHGRITRSSD